MSCRCQLCGMNFCGNCHIMVDEKLIMINNIFSQKDVIVVCPKCLAYNKRKTKYLREIFYDPNERPSFAPMELVESKILVIAI